MEKLAINGGKPVRTKPFPRPAGKRFGKEEKKQLKEAIDSGVLFGPGGTKVKEFEKRFAKYYGKKYCVTTNSGTAAIHTALGALKIKPGDEIITSCVTDMGTIAPIFLANAIPVLCDIDEQTYNMDPSKIEQLITPRTRAIIVVHLCGQSCDMDPIRELAKKHSLFLIEDCAQSYMSVYKGKINGTMTDIGCFSLNDCKHISCGEGGILLTDDPEIAKRAALFRDKCYYRDGSSRNPKFMAPNYRMSELQGAVAIAQLGKLKSIIQRRRKLCRALTKMLSNIPGIEPPKEMSCGEHSYFAYFVRVDENTLGVSTQEFSDALSKEGIPQNCQYLDAPIYLYEVFQEKNIHGETSCPYGCISYKARDISYPKGLCPVAERIMKLKLIFNIKEYFTMDDVKDIAEGIKKVTDCFYSKKQGK
ncbi:MAG TPA: DegT/DnrJ/EryC1/StrS family aminotransferase [Lentisphaeria bacterium]|nr:MAG: hypothetical protein A2X48_13725 [Lentisphaerae bacterium GWF2_49_21]HBC89716.1 DegT/DnrJ/EryC1/StrS family aminotransferase [Lentisphaeria bacterium]